MGLSFLAFEEPTTFETFSAASLTSEATSEVLFMPALTLSAASLTSEASSEVLFMPTFPGSCGASEGLSFSFGQFTDMCPRHLHFQHLLDVSKVLVTSKLFLPKYEIVIF